MLVAWRNVRRIEKRKADKRGRGSESQLREGWEMGEGTNPLGTAEIDCRQGRYLGYKQLRTTIGDECVVRVDCSGGARGRSSGVCGLCAGSRSTCVGDVKSTGAGWWCRAVENLGRQVNCSSSGRGLSGMTAHCGRGAQGSAAATSGRQSNQSRGES